MIIFNNAGHCFVSASVSADPIVWVDAQDISTYTLSGSDVLILDNKGTLGGVMTLNGSVKFANGGFESWSASDYITRDLEEPFLTDNSFTIVTTFNLKDVTSGSALSINWFSSLNADTGNRVNSVRDDNSMLNGVVNSGITNTYSVPYSLELQTLISTYNLGTNEMILLNYNGNYVTRTNVQFNNTNNAIQYLLKGGSFPYNTGQNNPLHEFRLYNRAMSLVEMQDLQAELNNKYNYYGNELVINGDFSNGSSDWVVGADWVITKNAKLIGSGGLSALKQTSWSFDLSKTYQIEYEIIDYIDGGLQFSFNSQNISTDIGVQTYVVSGVAGNFGFKRNGGVNGGVANLTIDNISVREILN